MHAPSRTRTHSHSHNHSHSHSNQQPQVEIEMLGVGPVEWDSPTERAHRHQKASTIHGWVVKLRGTLFGSESTRRAGIREMRHAAAIRRYKRQHPDLFRGRNKRANVFWIFPRRTTRSRSHAHRPHGHGHGHGRAHSRHDDRGRAHAHYGERENERWLRFPRRVKPHHHGLGTFLAGVLTGNRRLRDKGRALHERAAKERRRERRKRKRQRRNEAQAHQLDVAAHKNRWWHR